MRGSSELKFFMKVERLIQSSDLPESLWFKEKKCIRLPPNLVLAWQKLLEDEGLLEKAKTPTPEYLIGGVTKKATDDHLAWRFTGSSARVQMAMLDPLNALDLVADAFAKTFSGGRVFLADLPCGSGAAVLTILCTIAELRRTGSVPRNHLYVTVIGGELSEFARAYADRAITSLIQSLEAQSVFVDVEFLPWDACDKFSTTDLIKQLTLRSAGCSARMLVLANFSGFLKNSGHWKAAEPQFDALFLHSRDDNSCAIWIEPLTNAVITPGSGLFSKIGEWFQRLFGGLKQTKDGKQEPIYGSSNADVQHPLRPDQLFKAQLAVVRFDLPNEVAGKS